MNLSKFDNHTPGPWSLYEIDDTRLIMQANGKQVNSSEADTALILAAPELLAYCKKLLAENEMLKKRLESQIQPGDRISICSNCNGRGKVSCENNCNQDDKGRGCAYDPIHKCERCNGTGFIKYN